MNLRMRLSVVGIVVVGLVLWLGAGASAEEKAEGNVEPAGRSWKAGVDATFYSDYIWRGLDKFETSVSPSIYVRFPSFCVRATGIAETGEDGGMGEIDASFEYFLSVKQLDFSFGYMYYGYDDAPYSDTSELFGKVAWNTGTPIIPLLELNWDVDAAEALYGRLGVAYADKVENVNYRVLATLGAATEGFSETYFWVSESGLIDFDISFAMVIPVSEIVSFEPFVGFSVLLDDSIKTFVEDDSNVYGGAAVHLVF